MSDKGLERYPGFFSVTYNEELIIMMALVRGTVHQCQIKPTSPFARTKPIPDDSAGRDYKQEVCCWILSLFMAKKLINVMAIL